MTAVEELAKQLENILNKLQDEKNLTAQYAARCEELYTENIKLKEFVKKFDILLNRDALVESE